MGAFTACLLLRLALFGCSVTGDDASMADFSHLSRTAVSAKDAMAVLAAFTPQAPTGSTAAAIPSWADGMGGMAGTYRAGVCTMRCKRHSAATRTSVPHTLALSTPMRPTVTLNILIPQHLAPTTMLASDTLSTHMRAGVAVRLHAHLSLCVSQQQYTANAAQSNYVGRHASVKPSQGKAIDVRASESLLGGTCQFEWCVTEAGGQSV
jgi:hypothetical protein